MNILTKLFRKLGVSKAMPAKTQEDLVRMRTALEPTEKTHQVRIPGIEQLHTKPVEEIAEVIAMVLKSQPNIVEVRYKVGNCIELVTKSS